MNLIEQTCTAIPAPHELSRLRVQERLNQLTKPPGSLGRLEELALCLGALQGTDRPRTARKLSVIFAADHGVCARGVSAYPQAVTGQMVANFLNGGAAINVLARQFGTRVLVVDMGVAYPLTIPADAAVFRNCSLGRGTGDFIDGEAMSETQARAALETGITLALEQADAGLDVIAAGEMGIGNTTSSSVITALVTKRPVEAVVGPGTGVSGDLLRRKHEVVRQAAEKHSAWSSGFDLLRRVGGFEIGAMAGLMMGAASRRIPFLLDGFIATAAALIACTMAPAVRPYLLAAHCSQEPGHRIALQHLELEPYLDFQMRLGEGTGAAMLLPVLDAAVAVLNQMATFASAGVSGGAE